MHRVIACVLLLIALMGAAAPARAAAPDHDRARSAVEAGHIRPLQEILAEVRRQVPGRMLDARLQQNGRWVYEVILLQADGQVVAVTVDARTAQVLGVQGGQRRGGPEDPGRGGERSKGRGRN
jgi:uncharacterized membrane protein YkoI